jgi:hypothetical protein
MTDSDARSIVRKIWRAVIEPSAIIALVYAIMAFGASQIMDVYKSSIDRHDKATADQVTTFFDTTHEFDALAAAVAHGIMDKISSNEKDVSNNASAMTKLIANINRQYSEVQDLQPLVKNASDVQEYKNALEDLSIELQKVNSLTDMKNYWESISRVLTSRKALNEKLRRSANLALD